MADQSDSLLREIDEDLRKERLEVLWKKYGSVVIAAAVLLVAGVAGFKGWQAYDRSARTESAEQLDVALAAAKAGKADEAAGLLAALAQTGKAGYAVLARFQSADLALKAGDAAAAKAAYDALAADTAVDGLYRDLARLLGVMALLSTDNPNLSEVNSDLAPLAKAGEPWSATARELQAIAKLAEGDRGGARASYADLAEGAAVPPGLKTRANEMLTLLGE
ncbi:MAG: tetratricopeptide repeat protein [Rhodospirillales bacterium]